MTQTDPLVAHLELVETGADKPTLVTVTAPAVHRCPFKDEQDNGTVVVTWLADRYTLELHSLRAALDALEEWEVSHEQFTVYVHQGLTSLGLTGVHVTSSWETAGMAVQVHRP